MNGEIRVTQVESPFGSICEMTTVMPKENQEEFAKLFAASPNMLQALEKSHEEMMLAYQNISIGTYDKELVLSYLRTAMTATRSAINKATL